VTLKLYDPVPVSTPIGRVWTEGENAAEYFWIDGGWTSKEDPHTAKALTTAGVGREVSTIKPGAIDEVLIQVANMLGGKWERLQVPIEDNEPLIH
jgi:hypothetical protein